MVSSIGAPFLLFYNKGGRSEILLAKAKICTIWEAGFCPVDGRYWLRANLEMNKAFRQSVLIAVCVFLLLVIKADVAVAPAAEILEPEPPSPNLPEPPQFVYDGEYSIPILMYHQVDNPSGGLTVTPADFLAQMNVLKEAGYTAVGMDDVLLAMTGEPVPLPPKACALTFDDGYDCFCRNALEVLEANEFTATVFVVTGLVGNTGYLNWEQISELVELGYTMGCHTENHLDLCTLSESRLTKEISGSRDILMEKTDQAVLSFCYPAGQYNDQVVDAVEEAGFLGAVTTKPGTAKLSDERFTLKRIRVDGRESLSTFKNKLGIQ